MPASSCPAPGASSPRPRASSRPPRAHRPPPRSRPGDLEPQQARSQVSSAAAQPQLHQVLERPEATGVRPVVSQAQRAYDQAVSAQTTACGGGSSPACTQAKKNTTQARQQLQSANLTRQQNLLRDSKSLQDAQAQVTSAQQSLAPDAGAEHRGGSARVGFQLDGGRGPGGLGAGSGRGGGDRALAATTLRAPAAGVVASIAGKVGDAASTGSS